MPVNSDGTLRPYNEAEISSYALETRGIRDGSNPTEHYSPDGSGCERKYLCNWQNRFDVIKHLAGEVLTYTTPVVEGDDEEEEEPTGGESAITRLLPQTHPTMTNWVCVKASLSGHKFIEDDKTTGGATNAMPRWDAAEIVAQFEQVPFKLVKDENIDTELDRYVTKPGYPGTETEPFSQALELPGGTFFFCVNGGGGPHGKPVPHNLVIPQCGDKIQAIWHRVPEAKVSEGSAWDVRLRGNPVGGTLPWIGSLNKTTLFGRPPLTLLLESAKVKRRPDPTGFSYSADIHFTWIYRASTHVFFYFYDPTGAIARGYYLVGRKGLAFPADLTAMGDTDSMHHIRDHADGLFKVSA